MRYLAATVAMLVLSAPASAQSLFDGNWKASLSDAKFDPKPDVFVVRDGVYTCSSCVPAYSVPVDGKFHPIPDHPYTDAVAITVDGPASITERDMKGGKVTYEAVSTVSADGRTLSSRFTDRSASNGKVVVGDEVETRVAAGPPGSHALSGSWRQVRVSGMSDAGLAFSLSIKGDIVHYAAATGERIDGPFGVFLPVVGDLGGTQVRYERIDARTIRSTNRRGGKTVSVATITVAPDGRSLTNSSRDLLHGTTFVGKAIKQ